MAKTPNRQNDWHLYRRLLGDLAGLWRPFALSIAGFLFYSGSQVLVADWSQFVIDTLDGSVHLGAGIISHVALALWPSAAVSTSALHLLIAAAVVVLALIRGAGFFVGNYCLAYVSNHIVHHLRMQVFGQLLDLPAREFDLATTGNLIAKVTYHVNQVTGAATEAVRISVREGILVIGLIGYMLWLNWLLTLIFVAVLPLIALIVHWLGRRFRSISQRLQSAAGSVTQVASEVIGGFREVRLFGGRDYEYLRFDNASRYNLRHSMKMAFYNAAGSPLIQLFVWIAMALLVWVALDVRTIGTPGQFVAYVTAAGLLAKPIRQLSGVVAVIQKGLAACEDLYAFIDSDAEVDRGIHTTDHVAGRIEFCNISFAYDCEHGDVLTDFTLTIEPGATVALVGVSGSGKSTIVSLLARFYRYYHGAITLDGIEINDYQLANLRRHMAIVSQQVTLFNDTIHNNIAYGALANVSKQAVREAAVAARAMSFIERLPCGMDTVVGEDGIMLSGGQRQRLAIARAVLKDAPVLILDEATAALDNEAEMQIQRALDTLMAERTTLVIAHRLSTVEKADRIVVLDAGRIVESGTHIALMQLNGRYAALYERRFKDVPGS